MRRLHLGAVGQFCSEEEQWGSDPWRRSRGAWGREEEQWGSGAVGQGGGAVRRLHLGAV